MTAPAATGRRTTPAAWVAAHPWVWSFGAAVVAWVAISVIAGQGLLGTLSGTLGLVPFLVLTGVGQLMVITLGNGHIDLSLPNVVTLAAYVSTGIMNGGTGSTLLGFAVPFAVGLVVAAVNVGLVLGLRVPPIVATLAVGLVLQSAVLVYTTGFQASVDPGLVAFTRARVLGLSVLGLLCVLVAVAVGFVLFRTSYGRAVQAVGQNVRAARLAGIPVGRVVAACYAMSALLAALTGVLLGAFSTPNLDLGQPYLLNSIAIVVLGGSLISGGRSTVTGVWGGALFFVLLLTLLDVLGVGVALQNVVKGLLIILVLVLVGADRRE